MSVEVFAAWLRGQGYRVIRTKSSYWYNAAPGVFQAFPYHWVITPDKSEINGLMWWHGAVAVRYSAPFESGRGLVSYHIALREPYSLDHLKSKTRNGIKTGLSHFTVESISFDRLAMEGWVLQQDTLARQGRLRSMTQKAWERLCRSANDLPGFEAWAATSNGELAAALITARVDATISVPFALSHRRFLGQHVNNALFYNVSREMLQRQGVESIFFTVQSLDAPANVDEFKFRMGFQFKLVRQCVDFHPVLRPFATDKIHGWAKTLLQRDSSNPVVAKAEGMLRFHLEGQLPIEEQRWPEHLLAERSKMVPQPTVFATGDNFQITSVSLFDLNDLVDLHETCFSGEEHLIVGLGRAFVRDVIRWFVTSPNTFVLVARKGDQIVGYTALSDTPYHLPMLRACWRELIKGYLRHPQVLFDREAFGRLIRIVTRSGVTPVEKTGQIAFTGVAPAFQGQCIGKTMKEASIKLCKERGMVAMTTGVRRQNHRARALNEHAGFVEVPSLSTRRLIYLRLDLAPGHESTTPSLNKAPSGEGISR